MDGISLRNNVGLPWCMPGSLGKDAMCAVI
jgi:hypothetical protein